MRTALLAIGMLTIALHAGESRAYRTEDALGGLSFSQPLGITAVPGSQDSLIVLEKTGIAQLVTGLRTGRPTKRAFLDLTQPRDGKLETNSECGLLGMALHPRFAENGQAYVYYSLKVGGKLHQRLARFTVRKDASGDVLDPNSEQPLVSQLDPAGNHNGGDVHFGPDGYLYFSCGDGGAANDAFDKGRHIDKGFFAAVFRIDVDRRPGNLRPNADPAVHTDARGEPLYAVPVDNPFVRTRTHRGQPVDAAKLRTETWATGLRNAWRMSYDATTRTWLTGDVGQNLIEEIDVLAAGKDYGWPIREGDQAFGKAKPMSGLTEPIAVYDRKIGASVTGGRVYRGKALTELVGTYVCADFATARVLAMRQAGGRGRWTCEEIARAPTVAGFGENPADGELLLCSMGTGKVLRLAR
jgi:glucose/arabinose dehydrogenase